MTETQGAGVAVPPGPVETAESFLGPLNPVLSPNALLASDIVKEEQIAPADLVGLDNGIVAGHPDFLGSGSFGEVRKVLWRKTPVAAKVAHAHTPQEQKQLFLRELTVMLRLRHPNIVQCLGYVDSPFVIVMEYLPMGDLRTYWQSRTVRISHKCQICIDVLRALAYLHNRKPSSIVHRDVKPTNVIMTKSGVAKLTDFGLGRFSAERSVAGGKVFANLAPGGSKVVTNRSARASRESPSSSPKREERSSPRQSRRSKEKLSSSAFGKPLYINDATAVVVMQRLTNPAECMSRHMLCMLASCSACSLLPAPCSLLPTPYSLHMLPLSCSACSLC